MRGLKSFVSQKLGYHTSSVFNTDEEGSSGYSFGLPEEVEREFQEDTTSLVSSEYWTRLERLDSATELAYSIWEKQCEADEMANWAQQWVQKAQKQAEHVKKEIQKFRDSLPMCPKCDMHLVRGVRGPNGLFWGCEGFKDIGCRWSAPMSLQDKAMILGFQDKIAKLRTQVDASWEKVRSHWLKVKEISSEAQQMGEADKFAWVVLERLKGEELNRYWSTSDPEEIDSQESFFISGSQQWEAFRDSHIQEMAFQEEKIEKEFGWYLPMPEEALSDEEMADLMESVEAGEYAFDIAAA